MIRKESVVERRGLDIREKTRKIYIIGGLQDVLVISAGPKSSAMFADLNTTLPSFSDL